ncbi:MAG: AMP-binding protein [Xenococcaceae cyanobacterium MO_167.B27]|nr:AMP-binding protein [Xenococcaceae cyanobacterium MO_167.B27]
MFSLIKINKSDSTIDRPILGRTLPSLLDEACKSYPNYRAFNQWKTNAWQPQSNAKMRIATEELALGLLEEELEQGDKIALLMHSDLNFCLADFGSLVAGLINVPIDLTQTIDNIVFILSHSEAKVLIVSDLDLLAQIIPYLGNTPNLHTVIVADIPDDWSEKRIQLLTCGVNEFGVKNQESEVDELENNNPKFTSSTLNVQQKTPNYSQACLCIPMLLCQGRQDLHCPRLPQCIQLLSLDEVRARGKKLWNQEGLKQLRSSISPQDLATIVYIAGETGEPKGVMLSHENITADILTTFRSIPDLKPGAIETVLSFLPLTHIFARALIYGHLNYGHSIYFSTPNRAVRDFKTVQPTLVATVPRLLEKIYHKIIDRGSKLKRIQKIIFNWAFKLAQNYELGNSISIFNALQLKLADWLVFSQWRKPFGGRLKYFISGGAGLRAEIANLLSGAGMIVLQGYGLTETSSVICCNRNGLNRAGTVGLPIPGVEIAIAPDREILVKAPYVMQGYYKNPEATKSVIDESGWLHTGDLGAFTPEGFLTITGSKKDLFKLSTGKYVIPQPLEEQVERSRLVAQAVAVGREKKFCGMLIFPDLEQLQKQAEALGGQHLPTEDLLKQPEIIALYQTLVDRANEKLPRWSNVKQFQLVNPKLSVENRLLEPNLQVNRSQVNKIFAREINALYGEESTLSALRESLARKEFGMPFGSRWRLRSSELLKLKLLAKKFKLLSWRVVLRYFRNLRSKSRDFLQMMVIHKRTDKSPKLHPLKDKELPFLGKKDNFQLRSIGRHLKNFKNYLTLPPTMPWKLQEKNTHSEELESEITGKKSSTV